MKQILRILIVVGLTLIGANAMATEEAKYLVLKSSGVFELREYAPYIVAEAVVDGDFEDAGNMAFSKLFKYISGQNKSRNKIAMTAPVSQAAEGVKIDMTAPVSQQLTNSKWVVSFMMPNTYTLETLPIPNDSSVVIRQVPTQIMAAVRYSGLWTKKNYLNHKQDLEKWISMNQLKIIGEPIWARYNPPFTPWFMRRNEILIPVSASFN